MGVVFVSHARLWMDGRTVLRPSFSLRLWRLKAQCNRWGHCATTVGLKRRWHDRDLGKPTPKGVLKWKGGGGWAWVWAWAWTSKISHAVATYSTHASAHSADTRPKRGRDQQLNLRVACHLAEVAGPPGLWVAPFTARTLGSGRSPEVR